MVNRDTGPARVTWVTNESRTSHERVTMMQNSATNGPPNDIVTRDTGPARVMWVTNESQMSHEGDMSHEWEDAWGTNKNQRHQRLTSHEWEDTWVMRDTWVTNAKTHESRYRPQIYDARIRIRDTRYIRVTNGKTHESWETHEKTHDSWRHEGYINQWVEA